MYWEFLPYTKNQNLDKNQKIIGSQIIPNHQLSGETEYDVIVIIEQIVDNNYLPIEEEELEDE